ncbi:unnamed protein product, partial [Oncorhynchus mykiss]
MGMSDYNNGMNKPLGCRPQALSKDPSSDRSPFLDKDGGLSDDAPPSPFLPSPVSLKLPLVNNLQPGLALGSPGLNMQNLNNRQMQSGMLGSSGAALSRAMQQPPPQPSVPPLGSSQPSLRAQVPQFLTPQVQAQLLQFAAKNIGLNPALLTSPINPQQMTLLYQLQQLQMVSESQRPLTALETRFVRTEPDRMGRSALETGFIRTEPDRMGRSALETGFIRTEPDRMGRSALETGFVLTEPDRMGRNRVHTNRTRQDGP